ncbi:DUF5946 family protein [Blastococcus goldschmidtiae]|uniref:DUF5946 family protein n=1 Tax=Blastococcus goldschmidtiae TaxID=3075546 RepID=A0ABU2KAW8_9ACTN|nr:DUF5946 family protein [Blastococcus sp. DSM 46792]MDT0277333.1 DUF5946 family protein [Blastococcus sp. DSM 46792]
MPAAPLPEPAPATEACPGCGAVLAPVDGDVAAHPGASPSCTRLFDVTLRGPREEASADAGAVATARLADAAYDAQHPVAAEPARLSAALAQLGTALGAAAPTRPSGPPSAWTTTIADVAADLDVIDLDVLVDSWARAVFADWAAAGAPERDTDRLGNDAPSTFGG